MSSIWSLCSHAAADAAADAADDDDADCFRGFRSPSCYFRLPTTGNRMKVGCRKRTRQTVFPVPSDRPPVDEICKD